MQFKVYSRKYRDVMAVYGRYLAPYYDRAACYEYREAVINLETVGDFWESCGRASASLSRWTVTGL